MWGQKHFLLNETMKNYNLLTLKMHDCKIKGRGVLGEQEG